MNKQGEMKYPIKPKVVNNGNVFNTGNWYTFYCGNCGSQLVPKSETCEGSNPFGKGCGSPVLWEDAPHKHKGEQK
jgi:predicted RNA-binding Zn-ribbon protein involved in translation (DUF1610 family)